MFFFSKNEMKMLINLFEHFDYRGVDTRQSINQTRHLSCSKGGSVDILCKRIHGFTQLIKYLNATHLNTESLAYLFCTVQFIFNELSTEIVNFEFWGGRVGFTSFTAIIYPNEPSSFQCYNMQLFTMKFLVFQYILLQELKYSECVSL